MLVVREELALIVRKFKRCQNVKIYNLYSIYFMQYVSKLLDKGQNLYCRPSNVSNFVIEKN